MSQCCWSVWSGIELHLSTTCKVIWGSLFEGSCLSCQCCTSFALQVVRWVAWSQLVLQYTGLEVKWTVGLFTRVALLISVRGMFYVLPDSLLASLSPTHYSSFSIFIGLGPTSSPGFRASMTYGFTFWPARSTLFLLRQQVTPGATSLIVFHAFRS